MRDTDLWVGTPQRTAFLGPMNDKAVRMTVHGTNTADPHKGPIYLATPRSHLTAIPFN